MRAWLVGLVLASVGSVAAAQVAERAEGVAIASDEVSIDAPTTDLAGVLLADDASAIDSALRGLRERTGVQLAVVLVGTTGDVDIATFAQQVFERWGGGSAERDDGALFVLAIEDRRSRLHLGTGLEAAISDNRAKEMLDALAPALRAGDYARAATQITAAVEAAVSGVPEATEPADPTDPTGPTVSVASIGQKPALHIPLIAGLALSVSALLIGARRKAISVVGNPWGAGAVISGGAAAIGLIYWGNSWPYAVLWLGACAVVPVHANLGTMLAPKPSFPVMYGALALGLTPTALPFLALHTAGPVVVGCLASAWVLCAAALFLFFASRFAGNGASRSSRSYSSSTRSTTSRSTSRPIRSSPGSAPSSGSSASPTSDWSGGGGSSSGGGASSSW